MINILIIGLIWLTEPIMGIEKAKNMQVEDSPGLFFEQISPLRIVRSEWRIVIFLEMNGLKYNDRGFTELLNILKKNGNSPQYQEMITELQAVKKLKQKFSQLLTDNPGDMIAKRKSEYNKLAEHMSINTHYHLNQQERLHLYHSDADLPDGFSRESRELLTFRNYSLYMAKEDLNKIEQAVDAQAAQEIKDTSLQVLKQHLNYNRKLSNSLWEIWNYLREGRLHPSLIRQPHLIALISDMQYLSEPYIFPMDLDVVSWEMLMNLSELSYGVSGGRIFVEIVFPLVEKNKYELYKVYSLPVAHKLKNQEVITVYIEPSKLFLAIIDDQKYCSMTALEFDSCKAVQNQTLCILHEPIYLYGEYTTCEYELLRNPDSLNLDSCDIKYHRNFTPYWLLMSSAKDWLYSLANETVLEIQCADYDIFNITIQGVGVLKLDPGCVGLTEGYRITSTYLLSVPSIHVIFPSRSIDLAKIMPDEECYFQNFTDRESEGVIGKSLWKVTKLCNNNENIVINEVENIVASVLGCILLISVAVLLVLIFKYPPLWDTLFIHASSQTSSEIVPPNEIFDRIVYHPITGAASIYAIPVRGDLMNATSSQREYPQVD